MLGGNKFRLRQDFRRRPEGRVDGPASAHLLGGLVFQTIDFTVPEQCHAIDYLFQNSAFSGHLLHDIS